MCCHQPSFHILLFRRFGLVNAGLVFLYVRFYLDADVESYGLWELISEGFFPSFGLFVVSEPSLGLTRPVFHVSSLLPLPQRNWYCPGRCCVCGTTSCRGVLRTLVCSDLYRATIIEWLTWNTYIYFEVFAFTHPKQPGREQKEYILTLAADVIQYWGCDLLQEDVRNIQGGKGYKGTPASCYGTMALSTAQVLKARSIASNRWNNFFSKRSMRSCTSPLHEKWPFKARHEAPVATTQHSTVALTGQFRSIESHESLWLSCHELVVLPQ